MCQRPWLQSLSSFGKIGAIAVMLVGLTWGFLSVQELRAATITVTNTNDSGTGSLRQAISSAAAGDTIVFDPSLRGATITLTSSELSINKRLSIAGLGAGDLTISGNNARRIFNVGSAGVVTISGLTIANGYINNASGGAIYNAGSLALVESVVTQSRVDGSSVGVMNRGGGGIYNSGALTVTRSTISNNADVYYSAGGGGIYNAGTLRVEASTISGNQVHTTSTYGPYGGGGICNQQTAIITQSQILNNTATGYSYGGGGGIYNNGSLVMAYSTATGNSANDTFGGGLVNMMSGTLTLEYSTLNANQTTEDGGGIENAGVLTITHSTINGNTAQGTDYGGGGLDNTEGAIVIENSTFSGNTTAANGGGIHDYDGAITLNYTTITSNTARLGGGIYLTGTITDTMLEVSNSIVANSLASTECGVYSGTITTTITLIEDNTCNATLPGDPHLGPLQNNGGGTQTHALQSGSPAIDAGSCLGVTTDQRGYSRPIDIPDIANTADGCDLGAFEVQYVDLLPIKVVNDSHPLPGQLITYTITVQNIGFSTARDAVVSDAIDSRLTLGPITLDPPGAGTLGTPPTLVSGLQLAVGEKVTITLPATIGSPLAANTIIANSASATATDLVEPKISTVNITLRNAAPVPVDDVETTTEDAAITIHPLANDADANGDVLSIAAIGPLTYGHAALDGTQAIVYTPANRTANYSDVFTYTVSDGSLLAIGHITVNVTADNDPLTATDAVTTTTEDASIQAKTIASDPDSNDTLTYSLTGSPAYGNASVNTTTGTWIYTPTNRTANYTAIFTVTIADTAAHSGAATITVNVTADNDAPTANDAATSTNEDTTAIGTLAASDPDTNDALSYAITTQPTLGTASINATTAAWIYTPTNRTANYIAVFTATATDAGGRSDPATITVNVTADNDPLTASADVATSTNEDTAATGTITATDLDTNDTTSFSVTTNPTFGSASVNSSTGAWTYTPANRMGNYTAVFTLTAADTGSHTDPVRITVSVSADNDPVTASDVNASTDEDDVLNGTIAATDPDTNDTLSYAITTNPNLGTATINSATGAWTYTPINRMADYTAVFTVTVTDSASHSDPARVSIEVSAENDAPTANDASASTNEDTATNGTILATDPDTNDSLSYAITTNPNYGSATINASTGAWSYTPVNRTANYTAIFTVTVTDTGSHSDPARVTINVTADNDALTANDATASTNEDTSANGTISATDLDTNDTLSYAITTNPNYGSANINASTGAWVYTPTNRTANYTAVFTITVTDTGSHSDPARVTISVTADNDAPTANDATASTSEDTSANGTISATDPDTNDTLSYAITTNPNFGSASVNASTGAWTYTPINRTANYTAIFTVTVTDSASHSDPARVTVSVTADNDGPTANDATASTTEDMANTGTIVASDPDTNDTLSYAVTANPNFGAASINANTGAWIYTPTNRMANYTAIFTITVTDLGGRSDPGRVTINVTADNDPVTANDVMTSTNEDTSTNGTITATDPDTNDTLSYAITANPNFGTASINASTGAWTYTPINRMADYTAVFTVTVTDSATHSDTARVTINVDADNDAPTANDATASTNEDTSANGTIAATDPDTNDTLSYAITTNPNYGTATINSTTGAWTYNPINRRANYTAIFTVTVTDSAAHSDPARVTVSVTADNDSPTLGNTTVSTSEDTPHSDTAVATDPDTDDTLRYAITTNPNYGAANINASTGAWTYTPINRTANYTAIFTMTVTDLGGRSDPGRVTVNVTADNDAVTANNVNTSTNEDTVINGTITANDPDVNDTLSYALTTGPNFGSATVNASTGAWTYTPINRMADYTAVFTITVADTGGHTAPARVTIAVDADNDWPNADNTTASTNEDTPRSGTLTATDPDTDDTLSYAITTNPVYGSANINASTGVWTYTPINRRANYTAVFTVTVTDSASHSDSARVTINVTADNDAPTANDATSSTNEDTAANGTITATDPDTDDTLSYSVTTNPTYGSAVVNSGTGTWTYTPANRTASYTDVFTVTVSDTGSHTDAARITINVSADNDPVSASPANVNTNEDTTVSRTLIVTDPDTNDVLHYTVSGQPSIGVAAIGATTGVWVYTPTNRMGSYTVVFTLTVADTAAHTATAAITITVTADNDAPINANISATTTEDMAVNGPASATDPDTDDQLRYAITGLPTIGSASVNTVTGAWIYTPTNRTANYAAEFTLAAIDTVGHHAFALVTINVTADNDAPRFVSSPITIASPGAGYAYDVLVADNDTDATFTIASVTKPAWLTLIDHGDGTATLSGTPDDHDSGAHTVELRVTDNGGQAVTQRFSITVGVHVYLPLITRN
ncbi:MAG: Ig-like domain-containing protein [Anaerolineae bacterium]